MRVLLLQDNPEERAEVARELARDFAELHVEEIAGARSFEAALAGGAPDLVVGDHELPWCSGLDVLRAVKARWPDCPVLLLVQASDEELAVAALKDGLDDYVVKQPGHLAHVPPYARKALERAEWRRAVAEAQARYRALWEGAAVGLYRTTPDGRILDANRAFVEMLGYPDRESLLRANVISTYPHADQRTRWQAMMESAGVVRGFETELRKPDGSVVWVRETARVERDGDGRVKYYEGGVEDVTDRKLALEALARSEERYRALFDANPAPLFVYDSATLAFLDVNQAAIDRCGYSRDEFLAMTVLDLCPPEDVAALRSHLARARPERETAGAWRYRRKDGGAIEVECVSHALALAGRPARLVQATDVTERRRSEEERARLTLAVEQADEAIVITDPDGTIVYVNPACERITGYSRAEALGGNPRVLKSGKHDPAFYRELWATLLRGEVWRSHFVNKRKDGGLFEVEASISPVRDASGRLVNYVGVERDVTHERRLEEQFLQAQKMEAVGRLAGGVAHDFNNLLGVITGYSEMLLRHPLLHEAVRPKMEQILKAAERAASLTRQLLAFSRKQVLQPKLLDLNLVVADMHKMLLRLIGEDVEFVMIPGEALGTVKADPGQIEQVIMNLAVNARDSMPEGGRLTIETGNLDLDESYARGHVGATAGPHVTLAVSDTGSGMDAQVQSHIFEPFFTTKEQGKGTGLGLSTVYGIVAQSGGHISVESEVGRGTTFGIRLPRTEELRAAQDAADPGLAAPCGSETILLVEDEQMLRDLLCDALEGNGYTVLRTPDGERAFEIAGRHEGPIQLLLTDVVLPGISGREVAERLAPLRPRMRVLYMSGYTDDAILRHHVLSPDVAFLAKPFTPDALLRSVRRVLDGG